MTDSETSVSALQDLEDRLEGRLVHPGDPGWDDARRAWNLAVDQRPEAVVLAGSVRDVVATVDAARAAGLRVAPQSTGHSASPLGDLAGTVLLRLDALNGVHVDPARQTVRAEGGARWQDVATPAGEHGLAALAGSSPGVGVAGYTLGGGVSWMARSHGLAVNHVTALDVVTADGRLRTVGPDSDPDLFWALRGGGGGFGIVTALEFRLFSITEVYAGTLFFPMDRAHEVLHAWRRWVSTVPESVTSIGRVLRLPALDDLPEPLRGQSFAVIEAALQLGPEDADRVLAPLRALGPLNDTFAVVPVSGLAELHMDPVDPVPCASDGTLVSTLSADALDAVLGAVTSDVANPLLAFDLRHLGGMLEPGRMAGGAVSSLDAQFAAHVVGVTPTPESADLVVRAATVVLGALQPWANGSYLNFAERPTDPHAIFGPSLERLRAIKAAYDPHDTIRSNHPVARTRSSVG